MSKDRKSIRPVPRGRLSRLGQFGRLAGGVAGGVLAEGARRLADGERPDMRDLILTPDNVSRVAERLSHLRGAAMKMGQMISMDSGEMLPKELADIMARLRQNAHRMPPQQLQKTLAEQWGKDWRKRFAWFGASPIAAASIGQVHRAKTPDGRDLAIKVQYPGVRESIDADVDNVATLLRISNLLPDQLDIDPVLAEAKKQLHDEADYHREAKYLTMFGDLLAGADQYVVPTVDGEFTTDQVLAMSFVEGKAIESLVEEDHAIRHAAIQHLFHLVMREIFEFGVVQSDPNFANYRYQPENGRIVLLDFGAARRVGPEIANGYREVIQAAFENDIARVRDAAVSAGFINPLTIERHPEQIDATIAIIVRELNEPDRFDFGDRAFVKDLRQQGLDIAGDKSIWHVPPTDLLFVQRKISGMALLAANLKVKIDLKAIVREHLG